MYVEDEERRGRCVLLTLDDLHRGPTRPQVSGVSPAQVLRDVNSVTYQLALTASTRDEQRVRELRWTRFTQEDPRRRPCTLREVVGALEAYEPARAMTLAAIVRYEREPEPPSAGKVRGELSRLDESRYVLNRGIREAVLNATESGLVTMSQIAARCGHLHEGKPDGCGDTSWLQRRIGLMRDSDADEPSPWIDNAVLARIAREGLGIDPSSVEL
jgi:hypothetical protein